MFDGPYYFVCEQHLKNWKNSSLICIMLKVLYTL